MLVHESSRESFSLHVVAGTQLCDKDKSTLISAEITLCNSISVLGWLLLFPIYLLQENVKNG